MSKSIFKHYKFNCPECNEFFEKGVWTNSDGNQTPIKCVKCDFEMTWNGETQDKRELPKHGAASAVINSREKWKKKIPGEFRDWMEGPFSKRHGSEQNINMRDD